MNNLFANLFLTLKNRYFLFIDIIIFSIIPFLAIYIRIENLDEIKNYLNALYNILPYYILIKVVIFYMLGLYKRMWRFASIEEYVRILFAGLFILFFQYILTLLFEKYSQPLIVLPNSIPLIDAFLAIGYFGLSRFSIRIIEVSNQRKNKTSRSKPVIIVGAGVTGVKLLKDIQSDRNSQLYPVAFVDDNISKIGTSIGDVAVEGSLKDLEKLIDQYKVKDVIVAITKADGVKIRNIFEICKPLEVQTHILKAKNDFDEIAITQKNLRSINIEDLLQRDAVSIDLESVKNIIKYKRILVTGAGGSIGSEICRQVFQLFPSSLTIVGHGENSIFDIKNELIQTNSAIKLNSFIVDIRDKARLDLIFEKVKPEIIFHAAAHKHVPLMEENPSEAITNNVLGTFNLCELSIKHLVKNFVLISSDKAVNPISIMGTTKRIAELVVKNFAEHYNKNFVAVRFGNVLDSRGSVIPIFKKQIEKGGPVTVTHPDMTRYFMTIQEAVTLVLQSAALGNSGELFILDMGKPIKIVDLAYDLIRLSGVKNSSIDIIYSGLRPGEKLFEELILNNEKIQKTKFDKIFVANGNHVNNASNNLKTISEKNFNNFKNKINELVRISLDDNQLKIRTELKKLVPEFNGQK